MWIQRLLIAAMCGAALSVAGFSPGEVAALMFTAVGGAAIYRNAEVVDRGR